MDETECRAQLRPPQDVGILIRREGRFFRNVDKRGISKRYSGDNDDGPIYGFRVKWLKWRWSHQGVDGLSVNCTDCVQSPECSIRIDKHSERHLHVVEIDISALSETTGKAVCAQYSEVLSSDEPEGYRGNPCHYDLLPLDCSVEELKQAVRHVLEAPEGNPSWPQVKMPSTDDEKQTALHMKSIYDKVFTVWKEAV